VSKLAYISFLLLCLRQVHLPFFGYTLLLVVSRTICSVVTCEGGNLSLYYNPLPSQNPRSPRTSPLGLTTLNRKNHPIEVTLGGIGSSYASLPLQSLAFYPCYKLCDNRTYRLSSHRWSIDRRSLQIERSGIEWIDGETQRELRQKGLFYSCRQSWRMVFGGWSGTF
jgi:hypothetical protein